MPHSKKVCITLSDDLLYEIDRFKGSRQSRSATIANLLRYALTLPPYFREYDGENAEKEADNAIRNGNVESFNTIEEFLSDLKS